MTFQARRAAPLALGLAAALALAACASAPKPMGPVATHAPPPPPSEGPGSGVRAPGPVSESANPALAAPGSERDFVINAGDRVYFDFDSYTLREDARGIVAAQAAWLARYPAVHVRIEGNCDERGTREYNFALGARRANAVREALVAHGVSGGRIATVSYGKEHPIDTSGAEDGDARNRNAHTALMEGAR